MAHRNHDLLHKFLIDFAETENDYLKWWIIISNVFSLKAPEDLNDYWIKKDFLNLTE